MRKKIIFLLEFIYLLTNNTIMANAKTHIYNTDANKVSANKIIQAAQSAIMEYQDMIKIIATVLLGIGLLVLGITLVINFIRMASCPSHPIQKRKLMLDILMNCICISLLGAVYAVVRLIIYAAVGIM